MRLPMTIVDLSAWPCWIANAAPLSAGEALTMWIITAIRLNVAGA